jgi:hypothetical protein
MLLACSFQRRGVVVGRSSACECAERLTLKMMMRRRGRRRVTNATGVAMVIVGAEGDGSKTPLEVRKAML